MEYAITVCPKMNKYGKRSQKKMHVCLTLLKNNIKENEVCIFLLVQFYLSLPLMSK